MPRARELHAKLNSISVEQLGIKERLDTLADEEKILRDEFDGYLSVFSKMWEAEEKAKNAKLMEQDFYDEHRDNLIANENENGLN